MHIRNKVNEDKPPTNTIDEESSMRLQNCLLSVLHRKGKEKKNWCGWRNKFPL